MIRKLLLLGCIALLARNAAAHSASDAYLTLDLDAKAGVRLQWDIALRDLDFVLTLDDNGDGNISWAELRHHQAAIAAYAQAHLNLRADGKACTVALDKQWVDNHADGAYSALFLQAQCPKSAKVLTLDYRLFFDIDPSHRAIVVAHAGGDTATALLSPQNARIELKLPQH